MIWSSVPAKHLTGWRGVFCDALVVTSFRVCAVTSRPVSVGYLACAETLSTAPARRPDAFEHDQMLSCLTPAFRGAGLLLQEVSWDDADIDWSCFAAVIIGTTWDYQDRLSDFLSALDRITAQTILLNSADLVRWNSRKTYLQALEAQGVRTIPTCWLDQPTAREITACFATFNTDTIVVKQQVGACAVGQTRLRRRDVVTAPDVPVMVQPFIPSVATDGEISVIAIGGIISHALRKIPVAGDYRTQSVYGAKEVAVTLDADHKAAVSTALTAAPEIPLYARLDFLSGPAAGAAAPNNDGHSAHTPMLIEMEVIEPYLYPEFGPYLGVRMAETVRTRVFGPEPG